MLDSFFQKNGLNIKDCLFVAFLIIISDNTILFGTNSNVFFIAIKNAVAVFFTCYCSIKYILLDNNIASKKLYVFLLLSFWLFISSFWNNDVRMGIFFRIMLLALAFAITNKMNFKDFSNYFNLVMIFLATYSLFFWIVGLVSESFFSIFPKITNSAGCEFYNILFYQKQVHGDIYCRNFGMFREPGVYQFFLILGLFFCLNSFALKNKKWIFIYIVALLSTMSTTAYIALVLVLLFIIVKKYRLIKFHHILFVVFLCPVLFFIANTSFIDKRFDFIFGKFDDTNRTTTIARYASITENYRILEDNPIFGIGLTQLAELFPMYIKYHYGKRLDDNTNTIMIQFASHGFFYGFLFLGLLYIFCLKYCRNQLQSFILFCLFLVLLTAENFTSIVIPYIFMFYGLDSNFPPKDMLANEK